ncbi:MAG: multidrug effflux MFS transporter [Rhizobiaceae bacterium]|nr:multidrug effflux MFS transporter [Rhizobiaceae bacterium]
MNVHSEVVTRPPLMSERRVSLIGALMVAVGPVSMALFTPAMPEIVHAFGTTEAAVKLTLSLYFAGFAFAQLVCGPLSDGFGRRPVTIAFMAIFLAASVMALLAPNIHVLIAARFLQGVGAAVGLSVSRALVRDLFTHESSARILNLIGIILAIGPAVSPTLGGVTMELFGWHSVFVLMLAMGLAVMLTAVFAMKETIIRDLGRIRPAALIRSYGSLLTSPYFMFSSLVVAGTAGAIYAQATVLPFVLIGRVGLTPTQFGIGMLAQTLSYLAGSLVARRLMGRVGAFALVPVGLVFVGIGATAMGVSLRTIEPSYLSVMGPVALFAFGIAFAMPAMMTAAMAPFPRNAGAASAMMGFLQMGTGLAGGLFCAVIGDPVVGLATVVPCLGAMAIVSWLLWRRLPAPA